MKTIGTVQTGIQETTKDELEVRAGGQSVAKVTTKSFYTDHMISNPSVINTDCEIPADHNVVMSGPITIGSSGTLTVLGTLTIV